MYAGRRDAPVQGKDSAKASGVAGKAVFHATGAAAAGAIIGHGFNIAKSRWGRQGTWFAREAVFIFRHYQVWCGYPEDGGGHHVCWHWRHNVVHSSD